MFPTPKTILIILVFLSSLSNAQDKKYLVNSGELIEKAMKLHDEQEYKEAIKLYQQIPESDTNYCRAMYELALSALVDSQMDVGIAAAKKGLEFPSEYEHDLLLQLGNTFDESNRYDSAAYYFDECRKRFPNSYFPIHARGINYVLQKKYDSAFVCFRDAILINPYVYNSHYYMGLIAMEKGYPIQAMLAFSTSLLISPNGGRSSAAIKQLYNLANLSDTVIQRMENRQACKFLSEDYSDLESYFKSKIAFDKKYEIKTKVNDNIFRQLNLICEKLPSTEGEASQFFQNFYGLFFKEIFDKGYFNGAAVIIVSGINSDAVNKLVKEERKDMDRTSEYGNNRLQEIGFHRSFKQPVDYSQPGYLFSNSRPAAKGAFSDNKQKVKTGEWVYYNNVGNIVGVRNFSNDKLNGTMKLYHDNGKLSFEGEMQNDKLNGKFNSFYQAGNKRIEATIYGDDADGLYTKYYPNGSVRSVEQYTKGKLNGSSTSNYETGFVHYEGKNVNGKLEGVLKEYYYNGKLLSLTEVKNGESNGARTSYYPDGTVYEKGEMKDGLKEGLFTSYFRSGKILSKENYKKGKLNGNCIYYFENGVEQKNENYDGGDREGVSTEKNEAGQLLSVTEFRKSHYKKITFYNERTGQPIVVNSIDDKDKNLIRVYNSTGNLMREVVCNRDGVYNGSDKYYHYNGSIKREDHYENGKQNGEMKLYFENGKLQKQVTYKDDTPEGLYKEFHRNGQPQTEGMLVHGDKQGYWYTYDSEGKLTDKEYYLDNEKHGISYSYFASGKLQSTAYFDHGFENRYIEWDTSGKKIQDVKFTPGETIRFINHTMAGAKTQEVNVKNNYRIDTDKGYFPDGKVSSELYRKNTVEDSVYKEYYHDGSLKVTGTYENGEKHGRWISYNQLGAIEDIEHYYQGKSHGTDTFYSCHQTLETIIPRHEGDRHGWLEKYAPNGDLAYKFHYVDDLLVGYTYMLPDGTLSKEIYLENTAKKEVIKTYYKNGKLSCELECQGGEYNGKRILYYPDGKIWFSSSYVDGISEGEEKEFYMNGQLSYSFTRKDGNMQGPLIRYSESGKPISEYVYENGYLQGTSKNYTKTGALESTMQYYWGQLISVK